MMNMKLLPNQISSYREIVFSNLAFVDKTMFIRKLEEQHVKVPLFLRPRRFGKTLFTDVLSEYYDIDTAGDFERLFGGTDIGKNPTEQRNSYYILRFDFSSIDSAHLEKNFFETVKNQLEVFCSKYSSLNLTVNENSVSSASLLEELVTSFIVKRPRKTDQIFVVIDEYDNFANDVLATDVELFKSMTSAEGFVKNFYAKLKALSGSSQSAIGRFFVTGVSSIMLSSLTTGFNAVNISWDPYFHEMAGFTENELRELIRQTVDMSQFEGSFTTDELIGRMKLYFDGYTFCRKSENHLYNSSMCINYLSRVLAERELTSEYGDFNVNTDVDKFSMLMDLINEEDRIKIIRYIARTAEDNIDGYIHGTLAENLNINRKRKYNFREGVSMLFYLGYLTFFYDEENEETVFRVPNLSYRKMFMEYYLSLFFRKGVLTGDFRNLSRLERTGDITPFISYLDEIITGVLPDNESDVNERVIVSLAGEVLLTNLRHCCSYVEYVIRINGRKTRERADLVVINERRNRPSFLIEFKYLRETAEHDERTMEKNIEEKRLEAREQISRYMNDDVLKTMPNLQSYIIIYAYRKLIWEKCE